MGEFKNRLSRMGEMWKTGKEAPPGVPDAIYKCQLQTAEMRESGSGRLMIYREHLILEGEYAGEVVRDFLVLESEYGPRQVAEWITQMGYEAPENPEDIEEVVSAIAQEAPAYTAQVKKAKDSDLRNVRIRQLIDASEAPAAPAAAKKSTPKQVQKEEPAAEEQEASESGIVEGAAVYFEDEGTTYSGKVTEVKDEGQNALVETEDGSIYEVSCEQLKLSETAEEGAPEEETEDDARAPLLAFCQAHDIECTDEDTKDELVSKVNNFEYNKDELTAEEVELLEGIGATFAVKKAPPPQKPAAAKPAPKPAAKPAAKAAAKPAAKAKPAVAKKPAPKKK